jgi:hypothetical protein
MTPWHYIAIGAIVAAAILFRFDIVSSGDGTAAVAYRLDRWTGSIIWCSPQNC